MTWVKLRIPYSQTAYRTTAGAVANSSTGYRTDCSGFVSMAWNLTTDSGAPKSLVTWTLPSVASVISTASLQPGDALIKPYTHAMIFYGWIDQKAGRYWALEERNTQDDTTMSVRTVGQLVNGYKSYRFSGVDEDYVQWLEPLRGLDTLGSAIEVSRATFATGTATTVVVASNAAWPDALSGSSLAGAAVSPLLLVEPHRLRTDVKSELKRLGAKKVYILGGEKSVDASVAAAIGKVATVTRVAGSDRYSTAAKVAAATLAELKAHGRTYKGVAYITTGQNYPDALAIAPIAARVGRPVLLAAPTGLPSATGRALQSLKVQHAIALGGNVSLPDSVLASADKLIPGTVGRISGKDRYACALAIAAHGQAVGIPWTRVGVASGVNWTDGLVGGVSLSRTPSLLLLTPPKTLDSRVRSAIETHATAIGRARVFGDFDAVGAGVRKSLAQALGM